MPSTRYSEPARSTTILSVRRDGVVALGGDGQVTLGATVAKHDAIKIRRVGGGKVLTGFAGSAADAFALLERFEKKLSEHPDNTRRAVIELAKEWRTDRVLRRLEAMLASYGAPHDHDTLWYGYMAIGLSQGIFALFTMYLPPLFPTLLRTTGAGFCYNFGRIAAGLGTVLFGLFAQVGDYRLALLYAGFLFLPAGAVALLLPIGAEERREPLAG